MSWPTASREHPGPLVGVRVLDLSAYAVGPWSTSLLAMLGGDVIKVDPPYGDHIRGVRPLLRGEPTTYTTSNQGKRDIVLDLKAASDRDVVLELARNADVLVENFRSGTLDRLGLGYATLRQSNPRLVYCSSSSYGDEGPLAGVGSTDPHGQAFSGFVSLNGEAGGPPEFLRYHALIDLTTSSYLAASALLGLQYRERAGIGCHLDSSQMESALAIQATRLAEFLVSGVTPTPAGTGAANLVPSGAFLCRDSRHINVTAPDDRSWIQLCHVIERDDLAERPDLASNAGRVERRHEVEKALAEAFAGRDLLWWRLRLAAAGVPNGGYLTLDEMIEHGDAHPLAAFVEEVAHPISGTIWSAAPPWRFSRTPARLDRAPLPGEHGDEIKTLVEEVSAASSGSTGGSQQPDVGPVLPLASLRVVELAQGLAGPYCGLLLAGTGAEVLKLEPPQGDAQRQLGPPFVGGASATYSALNRGKRIVRMDWSTDEGGRRLAELLARADVVVVDRGSNGLAPVADLAGQEIPGNPRAVVCGISPAGEDGPLACNPATELEVQGLSGITRYLGSLDGPPVRLGADVATLLAGVFAFQGILAALHERGRSGTGQYVGVSALAALTSMSTVMIAALTDPDAWEGFHCLAAAYPPEYGVRTSDGAVAFSGPRRQESDWVSFCEAIGAAELARHPDFDTDAKRLPRSKELGDAVEPYLRARGKWEIADIAARHGGIAVPVQQHAEVLSHPQTAAMKVVDQCETAEGERFQALAMPWRLDGMRLRLDWLRAADTETSGWDDVVEDRAVDSPAGTNR